MLQVVDMCCVQGKSLSVICGALRWLEDREQRDRESAERTLAGSDAHTAGKQDNTDDGTVCMYVCMYVAYICNSSL